MKRIFTFLTLGFGLLGAAQAHAQCAVISNPQERFYCEGTTGGSPSRCNGIFDTDRRMQCLAIANREPVRCNIMKDAQQRALCKAQAQR